MKNYKIYLGFFAGFMLVVAGFVIIFREIPALAHHQKGVRQIFGAVVILYGAMRFYRSYMKYKNRFRQ